ncbi:MAG TPA: potassium channel family protein [Ktedonobacteraceae bacterium]|nr:potassium channel family protein [Ktedonobacteraceae bacterium]
MNIIAGIIAVFIIYIILQDAFETIILPRRVSRSIRFARMFYFTTWRIWSLIAKKIHSNDRKEYYLSFYGPLSLIFLLVLWAAFLILGFALLQFAFGSAVNAPEKVANFGTDFYMSGTTFFTLGLGDVIPRTGLARVVTIIEAGMGFGFLALVIGYLPVIYQSFSRREVGISLLDAHAGSPPSAIEMLRRHSRGQVMGELVEHLHDWENWSADLLESQLSYPVLMYYRSQHDRQSWLAALTAILDVSALLAIGIDDVPRQSAWFTFAIACHAAVDLGQIFAITPETSPIRRLPHDDFLRLRETLAEMGIRLHEEETAEQRLADLREKYEPYVIAMAKRLQMPLPGWLAEEDTVDDWQTSAWNHKKEETTS